MKPTDVLQAAESIAREAGEILLGFAGEALDVRLKGEVDLVTAADRASEERIVQRVRERFPHHGILAEESGALGGAADPEFLWVIDPLDGTTNFASGLPIWSVSIGVLHRGARLAGVVHDPSRGECFTALRGEGTRLNGRPVRVSGVSDVGSALLVTGFPYDIRTSRVDNLDHFERMMRRSRAVRRLGSAAIDLAYVACGRFDGFWELKLHPWDVAAGSLLVEEAGGLVTDFDGAPFDVFGDEIVAGPAGLTRAMIPILASGRRPGRRGGSD
jgi:myo-inositol-1(or 4)-monophosphatase